MCANAWGFCPARATLWPVMVVAAAGRIRLRAIGALWGAQIEDAANARTIYIAVGGLLLLAVAVAVGTTWWWRNSSVEHPALGPLEVMGTRSWWKGDWTARRRRLDAARPAGAEPETDGEAVDLTAVVTDQPLAFDDLADPDAAAASTAPPETWSLEELVASLGVDPAAAVTATDDTAVAAPSPLPATTSRPNVVIDTSAPSRDDEPVAAAVTEQRAPIDPLLRQQRSE